MVDYLIYEGEPIAVPALRIMAVLSGNLHDKQNHAALARVYSLFEGAFGEAANVTAYNFPGHSGKIRWMNPALDKAGKDFFERSEAQYGEGLRRYGYTLSDFEEPALPYVGVEQVSDLCFVELALPAEDQRSLELARIVEPDLASTDIIWGVMGFGMFLPHYKSSLAFELGKSARRYRTSLEITPSMVTDGLRREGSAYRWAKGEEPGLPDIGWKTFVGREFWPRIPNAESALAEASGVTAEQIGNALVVTAGSAPIWGDINADEDVAPYKSVAEALLPLRFPRGAAIAFFFGGDPDAPDTVDTVETYLGRYVPLDP